METALFVGRFQPFHLGHKESITTVIEEVDELVVAVGSADSSHTSRNPFTAGERIRMVRNSLEEFDDRIYTIPIVDIDRNALWIKHVESLCPRFNVVYTNNSLVARLFEEEDYKVRNHETHYRDRFSGTEVRDRIINHDNWEDLVPEGTVQEIHTVNGLERIRKLSTE